MMPLHGLNNHRGGRKVQSRDKTKLITGQGGLKYKRRDMKGGLCMEIPRLSILAAALVKEVMN